MSDAELPELDVSVITFNSARWMAPFLDSLVGQEYPASRINLWVRDNGSSTAEYEQCRQEIERHRGAFGSVRIGRGENVGFGAGHNRNFAQGRAVFFLVTNVDLEFERGSIAAAVGALRADDATVACREFRQQPYEHPKHYHPATLETAWCSSACVLFRREAFAATGGYDERIFLYGEDVELSFRLRALGYVLKYCPGAVCRHHAYAHAGEVKPDQFFGSMAANLYLRLRYGSPWQIIAGLLLQASRWVYHPRLPGYYSRLAANTAQMVRNAPHFLASRRRGPFPISLWRYGPEREGAFYVAPPAAAAAVAPPLASLVVRTHAGRLGWLREAVASVAHQTYRRIELIVVEDGSTDARIEIERLAATCRLERVCYLSIDKAGRCRAGNAGLAATTGELVGFLDDDDLLYADHVETLVAELGSDAAIVAAYASAFEVPTRLLSREPFRYREYAPAITHDRPFSRAALLRGNFLPIQSVLFRRRCYEQHGGFDETLDKFEDWDLWTRYSLDADFTQVAKTTSLYRIPADPDELLRRNCELEDYYLLALARQGSLEPRGGSVGAVTMAARHPRVNVSPRTVRRLLAVLPFLRPLYLPSHRLAVWWRRGQRRLRRA